MYNKINIHRKTYIRRKTVPTVILDDAIFTKISATSFIFVILFLILAGTSFAAIRRCFSCRSRGSLGDCKDPFTFNSTTFDDRNKNLNQAIEAVPCASGWCAKLIEDDYGDAIAATERYCMTRPPTDNEERCSETVIENHRDRKVFLCMCYGDLCNLGPSLYHANSNLEHCTRIIIGQILVYLFYRFYYNS